MLMGTETDIPQGTGTLQVADQAIRTRGPQEATPLSEASPLRVETLVTPEGGPLLGRGLSLGIDKDLETDLVEVLEGSITPQGTNLKVGGLPLGIGTGLPTETQIPGVVPRIVIEEIPSITQGPTLLGEKSKGVHTPPEDTPMRDPLKIEPTGTGSKASPLGGQIRGHTPLKPGLAGPTPEMGGVLTEDRTLEQRVLMACREESTAAGTMIPTVVSIAPNALLKAIMSMSARSTSSTPLPNAPNAERSTTWWSTVRRIRAFRPKALIRLRKTEPVL
jgi:hypothetical protein